jgi:hypothetical protein
MRVGHREDTLIVGSDPDVEAEDTHDSDIEQNSWCEKSIGVFERSLLVWKGTSYL